MLLESVLEQEHTEGPPQEISSVDPRSAALRFRGGGDTFLIAGAALSSLK